MTALTYPPRARINLRLPAILLLIVALAIAAVPRAHAVIRHGNDAVAIRQCAQTSSTLNFKSRSPNQPNKYLLACRLPDGRWGLQVVECIKSVWREVTSFVPKDGSWAGMLEYVSGIAVLHEGELRCSS